jgi:5'-nucleotidase
MSTPLVCANLDLAPFELGKYVKPYVILEKGRMKVGVIGLTADLSTNVSRTISSRIQQLDAADAVNKCLDAIRDSCDLVILLSHYGFEEDKALVPQTRGLDLVVGAHSHIFMDAMEDLVDADGRTVPMITDGCYGKEVGVVKVW